MTIIDEQSKMSFDGNMAVGLTSVMARPSPMRVAAAGRAIIAGLGLLTVGTVAQAQNPFTDLSTAGAENYGILGLGGGKIDLSNVTVNGSVGIGAGGSIVNMAPSTINGSVFESTAGQYSGPGHVTGSTTVSSSMVFTNVTGAATAASDAAAAATTLTSLGAVTSATTITGVAGLNVIDITGGIDLKNANLTLNGPAGAFFVINVTGNLSLVGSASLSTAGGLADGNILYNFLSSNASITTHVGDSVNGILLADGSGSSMNLDGTFNGELIGNSISLLSNAVVNDAPSPAPEVDPASAGGALTLLFGALSVLRGRRKQA